MSMDMCITSFAPARSFKQDTLTLLSMENYCKYYNSTSLV